MKSKAKNTKSYHIHQSYGGVKTGGKILLKINKKFYRPAEVELLLGDPSEAQNELNWEKIVDFKTLVRRMIENDIKEINEKDDKLSLANLLRCAKTQKDSVLG